MTLTESDKIRIKRELVERLSGESEIDKIVVFGSFLDSCNPNDVDVAIFQNSSQKYLQLALRYRKMTRDISTKIALDIIPLKAGVSDNIMLESIARGEVIFER